MGRQSPGRWRWNAIAQAVVLAAALLLGGCASEPAAAPVAPPVRRDGVPVRAFDGCLERRPAAKEIPLRHFETRDGRVVDLSGPRVRIELPARLPVDVGAFSLEARGEVANPLSLPRPDARGAFVPRDAAGLAMTTAFYWATRTIEAVERWAGHRVSWGEDGRLVVVPCAFVSEAGLCYYDSATRRVLLGASPGPRLEAARSPDAVVHECMHAALAALKPGHEAGVAIALHEGLADMASCLVALEDAAVVRRVLARCGGDLRRDAELSRFDESGRGCRRAVRCLVTPSDCGIEGDEADLPPGVMLNSGGPRDPHRVGQVVSGALHELLVLLYEREVRRGEPPGSALAAARDAVGSVMVRALAFVGEHRVSLRDYALALLEAERIPRERGLREELWSVLVRRGLVDEGKTTQLRPPLDGAAALAALGDRGLAPAGEAAAADGVRVVRFAYRVASPRREGVPEAIDPVLVANGLPAAARWGFVSLIYDPQGRLIRINCDAP